MNIGNNMDMKNKIDEVYTQNEDNQINNNENINSNMEEYNNSI